MRTDRTCGKKDGRTHGATQLRVKTCSAKALRMQADGMAASFHDDTEVREKIEHRENIVDKRNVAQDDRFIGHDHRGKHRKNSVLIAGWRIRAGEAFTALYNELGHKVFFNVCQYLSMLSKLSHSRP